MGMGYKGSTPPEVITTKPENATIKPRKVHDGAAQDNRDRQAKVRQQKRLLKTKLNKQAERLQKEIALDVAAEVTDKELTSAQLAGQMVAGIIQPNTGSVKPNVVTSHPDFRKIEVELILTRGADIEGLCHRFKIVDAEGNLAVAALVKHFSGMRRRYSKIFDTLDQATKDKMAQSYMSKVDEIYNLAKADHTQAMAIEKATDYGLIADPNFAAAGSMLDQMRGAATLLGAALERQDKKDSQPEQTGGRPGPTVFQGPVGRVQILGLPKAANVQRETKVLPPADMASTDLASED